MITNNNSTTVIIQIKLFLLMFFDTSYHKTNNDQKLGFDGNI